MFTWGTQYRVHINGHVTFYSLVATNDYELLFELLRSIKPYHMFPNTNISPVTCCHGSACNGFQRCNNPQVSYTDEFSLPPYFFDKQFLDNADLRKPIVPAAVEPKQDGFAGSLAA